MCERILLNRCRWFFASLLLNLVMHYAVFVSSVDNVRCWSVDSVDSSQYFFRWSSEGVRWFKLAAEASVKEGVFADEVAFEVSQEIYHVFVAAVSTPESVILFGARISIHSTPAEGYAWEITTVEGGYGLDEILTDRKFFLSGITNGIDTTEWDPSADKHIAAYYSVDDLSEKVQCKIALQKELGLPQRPDCPLYGWSLMKKAKLLVSHQRAKLLSARKLSVTLPT